ncbi:MAG: universal stress protein [Desulfobacterales bacterium]
MYKKILVPLDGSQRAEAILEHVKPLALGWGARVVLLQVVESSMIMGYEGMNITIQESELSQLREQVENYLAGMAETLEKAGLSAEAKVILGPVVEGIIETANSENADLVAMASHGRTGLSRVFYGSVAAGVLNRIDRPLLLIRTQA